MSRVRAPRLSISWMPSIFGAAARRRLRPEGAAIATHVRASSALLGQASASAAPLPGDLVVADAQAFAGGGSCVNGCGGLITVDPSTGAETALSSNSMAVNASSQYMNGPFTLTFDASGDIIVGETAGLGGSCPKDLSCGGIVKVDPATGEEDAALVEHDADQREQPILRAGQWCRDRLQLATSSSRTGAAASGCGKIISVDPSTGKETLVSSNSMPVNTDSQLFQYPQGLAIAPSGEIYVADALAFGSNNGGIIGVDPTTGKETEVSANSMPVNAASQDFVGGLAGLAVDACGRHPRRRLGRRRVRPATATSSQSTRARARSPSSPPTR